uniref:Golgi associated, gamma adaptin ear containing, ARF binding protein 3 n=1 Tax=Zonotrichia albicollis TaxID=44394 RepID=A0A8D2N7H6_ZONAL
IEEVKGEATCPWPRDKATNPSNRQEDWEYIIGFCDQINKELEGPQIAVRLLAHKIQSPQEWEAVQALTVLEACMKNCGRRFHNEVGKFRFLNELIKVVSPKYLGDRVSEKVKSKVIELLYSWTVALPEESKIKDAYYMLKRQGIVMFDPVIPADRTLIPSPPPRPKNPVFDDEEKSKLLAKLLKSKNPDDLQEANKLIKSMVKEDEARIQKVTKRMHTLEEVNNNVKLLNEMLVHYSKEDSSEADKELMKELYERCETKRRTLFKLASETEDNDSSLGDILQASDNLSRVINSYKKIIEGQVMNGEVDLPGMSVVEGSNSSNNLNTLIDLAGLDVSSAPPPPLPPRSLAAAPSPAPGPAEIPILPPPPQAFVPPRSQAETAPAQQGSTSSSLSLLDEELLCLVFPGVTLPSTVSPAPLAAPAGLAATASGAPPAPFPSSCPAGSGSPLFQPTSFQQQGSPMKAPEISLANVHVPLESIKPSSALPVTAYDKNGFRILLHFARECPPGRSDVLVVVVSSLRFCSLFHLQSMKVKLQPPSGTELSPFNPIQPPAAITQVMLLANPAKEKVRLRYRLTFTLGDQPSTEVGEVDQFPPVEQWGNL